ncbi:MAG: PQQ-binding-like beta-propeller repeat protein [Bacteroidales bacterium]|nr:PQQ-binding-like beta-propeller repeat protein [Bacteroidales bacterium]
MKHFWQILFFLLLCSCSHSGGRRGGAMDWTLFRGNASLSGYTNISLPHKPVLLWSYNTDSRTVSSPVVKSGVTYWCDRNGMVYGVNIDGEKVFEFDFDTSIEATPMIDDSVLYVGTMRGRMNALSLNRADTLWSFGTDGQISASPNMFQSKGEKSVIFGSYDYFLYTLNNKNGSLKQKYESNYYLNGAVALWNNYALFGGCDAWVRIIDCNTGMVSDSLELQSYVPASPAIDGNFAYLGDYSGVIYEFELGDGKILNKRDIMLSEDEDASFSSVPAISSKMLYVLSSDRYLYAIDRIDGNVVWKYLMKGNTGESSPTICDDKIIACTKTGIVVILDAEDGSLLWEYDTGEQIVASPAIIRDHFLILTSKGTLMCFGENDIKKSNGNNKVN